MLKRIVLTGTYCSKNKGDAAMRIATADAIRKRMPGSQVTILTPFLDLDRYAYNGDPILQCSRRSPHRAARLICGALVRSLAKRIGIDMRKSSCSDEMRSYLDADLIVDLSGDGLTEEYGLKCVISHFVPIVIGLLLNKPVFVCAQTIGPLKRTGFLAKRILNRVDVISAREMGSMEYLQRCNLTKPRLCLAADMAFSLKPCSVQQAMNILEMEGVDTTRPLVGMSVSRLHGHMLEVGVKCQNPGEFTAAMAAAADRIIENYDADVVLISHTTGPGTDRDDREAAVDVRESCGHAYRVHVIRGDYSPGELKGLIGRMQLFIGLRMHSNIAALCMYVPTVAIAYGPKAAGIMSLVGQGERVIDLRALSESTLFTMVDQTWNDRADIRRELEVTMPRIKDLSAWNIEIIAGLLNHETASEITGIPASAMQDGGNPID